MNKIKMVCVSYFNSESNIVEFELNDPEIKQKIGRFIHSQFYSGISKVDYILTKFKNDMYVIEKDEQESHVKTQINYHPLMELL